jgi:hypothetical protein
VAKNSCRKSADVFENAYRVLLTRARQGMVIVVPHRDVNDPTRDPSFYDPVYAYLADLGIKEV